MVHFRIDNGPVYECVVSLHSYLHSSNAVRGQDKWRRDVNGELSGSTKQKLSSALESSGFCLDEISLLIAKAPQKQTVVSFLSWMTSLSSGDLYNLLVPELKSVQSLGNLDAWRQRYITLIDIWFESYFAKVEEEFVLRGEMDSKQIQPMLTAPDSQQRVEVATRGFYFEPGDGLQKVILVPTHHQGPVSYCLKYNSMVILYFSPNEESIPGNEKSCIAKASKALGDEIRLEILESLAGARFRFKDLIKSTNLSKSTLHNHLITLRDAGFVRIHVSHDSHDQYSLRSQSFEDLRLNLTRFQNRVTTRVGIEVDQ